VRKRHHLYQTYDFEGVTIGFRDHGLSDLIGFTYRFKSPEDAANHFLNSLEPIYQAYDDPSVFVIVDGENAWEFYENNGFDFFTALYSRLEATSWCKTDNDGEASEKRSRYSWKHLQPGSWITGRLIRGPDTLKKIVRGN
jgi:alpha-amylase/alpha-mannosidase (GH57 family)